MRSIPVTTFSDPATELVQGLKKRFLEANEAQFSGVKISTLKTPADLPQPKFEIIVLATGGMDLANGLIREYGASLMVFAGDKDTSDGTAYKLANALTERTAEYLQSLTALRGSKIKYVSIDAAGIHIENPGPQQLRNLNCTIRCKATKTNLYPIGE